MDKIINLQKKSLERQEKRLRRLLSSLDTAKDELRSHGQDVNSGSRPDTRFVRVMESFIKEIEIRRDLLMSDVKKRVKELEGK